jgi:hypothetical protein
MGSDWYAGCNDAYYRGEVMKKEELEDKVLKLEIAKEVSSAIRIRCLSFWSGVLAIFAMIGSWASDHSKPVAAAWRAFWSNYP